MKQLCPAVLLVVLSACPAWAAQAPYAITDIGSFAGNGSAPYSINNGGQVVGADFEALVSAGVAGVSIPSTFVPYIYSGGQRNDLQTISYLNNDDYAVGINNSGQIITAGGEFYASPSTLVPQDLNTILTGVPLLTYWPAGINDSGQIVGYTDSQLLGEQAFVTGPLTGSFLSSNQPTLLGTMNGKSSYANAINNLGQITGAYTLSSGVTHAFLWANGISTDLGAPTGGNSYGEAINNFGQVAGVTNLVLAYRAFVYANGTMTNLGTIQTAAHAGDTDVEAYGINTPASSKQIGQIVGLSSGTSGTVAFLYANGVMADLNTLIDSTSGWKLIEAGAINDNGQIVGQGTNSKGQYNSFLLTPTSTAVAPTISSQPVGVTVASGASASLSVLATAAGTPTYQWYLNGTAVAGATGPTYTISAVQSATVGNYTVQVSSVFGSVTSAPAVVAIVSPPAITTPPYPTTANVGSNLTLSVASSGSGLSYQWQFNGSAISGATASSYTLSNAQFVNAGNYTVTITNSGGSTTSSPAAVTIVGGANAPSIAAQPVSQTITSGSTVVFSVTAAGTVQASSASGRRALAAAATTYQWQLNGSALSGATSARLVVSGATSANAGLYTCLLTSGGVTTVSAGASLSLSASTNPGRLVNVSVNTIAGKSQGLTVGFVVGGANTTGTEHLLIRADGPALTALGVSGALADPTLTVLSGQTTVASNDNWSSSAANSTQVTQADNATGAFALPVNSLDAALVTDLASTPGYTVQISGNTSDNGTVVAEVYDDTANYTPASPRLINLSCNSNVAAKGSLTEGFTVLGDTSKTVLIRATGPTLAALGVSGTMPDPQIALHTSVSGKDTILTSNAGWGGDPQIAAVSAGVGAFGLVNASSQDSVVLYTLAPGAYTAVASSVSGAPGVTVVEVYEVP